MDRLRQLVDGGAATRRLVSGKRPPTSVNYSLTPVGEELLPILADALEWERRRSGG
jgi:DNA-binding HxlR family transcriptional regulator